MRLICIHSLTHVLLSRPANSQVSPATAGCLFARMVFIVEPSVSDGLGLGYVLSIMYCVLRFCCRAVRVGRSWTDCPKCCLKTLYETRCAQRVSKSSGCWTIFAPLSAKWLSKMCVQYEKSGDGSSKTEWEQKQSKHSA